MKLSDLDPKVVKLAASASSDIDAMQNLVKEYMAAHPDTDPMQATIYVTKDPAFRAACAAVNEKLKNI